jgi:hypothetical protein
MLQAFIDDSKSDGKLFVLAGYIAPAETWAAFADEWQAELERAPRFDEFKMKAMNYLRAWDRCQQFYLIIEKHVSAAISVKIDLAALSRVTAGLDWPPKMLNVDEVTNPYWFAYTMIIDYLYRHHTDLKLTGRVDFIFDEQSEERHVRGVWDYFKSTSPPAVQSLMGDEPTFKSSHEIKPLQAADLWAWWVRRWHVDGQEDGAVRLAFPWIAKRDLRRLEVLAGEKELRVTYEVLVQHAWALFAAKHLHLNPYCVSWIPWHAMEPSKEQPA